MTEQVLSAEMERVPQDRAAAAVQKLRLGFAGVGWIGRNRLEAIARALPIEVAALADPSQDAMAKVVENFAHAQTHDRFEDLLQHKLDGIVIATPSGLHAQQAIAALEA